MMFISLGAGTVIAVALIVVMSILTGGRVSTVAPTPALVGHHVGAVTEPGVFATHVTTPWADHHATAVIFFGSWCEPCQQEMPKLASYLSSHSTGAVTVIGVAESDNVVAVKKFFARLHLHIPVMLEGINTPVAAEFGVGALPDTAFVNAKGVVTGLVIGKITTAEFAQQVATA